MSKSTYTLLFKASVEKFLRKLDKKNAVCIKKALEDDLVLRPKDVGMPLRGQFRGFWRYRVGDYRVIYTISEKEILVLVVRIAHRKDVYR